MHKIYWTCSRWAAFTVVFVLAAACNGNSSSLGELPAHVGYLRASSSSEGSLTIFDADTFEIYRTVKLPPALVIHSHRLEIDPAGRIWIGSSQAGIDRLLRKKDRVLVFSPQGDLEYELDLGCNRPYPGIAFANGYAFIGCSASGFYGRMIVVDTATMQTVKTFDKVHPPDQNPSVKHFHLNLVAEVAGLILVIGKGSPPRDYQRLTSHSAPDTRIGVLDPQTLEFRGYLTGFEPGLRIKSVQEVDGKAWLFNELSHLEERPPRVDVYVVDPATLRVVDRFNLERPFPRWSARADDATIYIAHVARFQRLRDAGYQSGVTRLDLTTGAETFWPTPDMPHPHWIGVQQGRHCLVERKKEGGGLWCMNDQGALELKIPQEWAAGAVFSNNVSQ